MKWIMLLIAMIFAFNTIKYIIAYIGKKDEEYYPKNEVKTRLLQEAVLNLGITLLYVMGTMMLW